MADETRTVIIDVEVEDKDFDQEIGNVNTALKENRALIKELSKDYKGNAKEIAKLEAENRDLSKSKQSLAKESKAEAGSLDALRLKLANQTKERNGLNTSTEEGAARFKQLQGSIGDLNEEIGGFEQEGGDFRRNVGNYPSLADKASGAFGGLWKTLMANPLILLGAALAGLVKVFSETQAGAEFFAKVSAGLNAVLGLLKDMVEGLGVFLIDIFSNPQQALEDFGQLIKENFVNRFEGLLELIPSLGKAITLLFKGKFAESGKVALDAVAKVTLGVESFTEKVNSGIESVVEFADKVKVTAGAAFDLEKQMIANTKAQADQAVLEAQSILAQKELELLMDDTTKSTEARIAAAIEFARVEEEQIAKQIELAEERIRIFKAQNELSNSTEEDIQRVRDEEINLANLQAASADRRRAALTKENAFIAEEKAKMLAQDKLDSDERIRIAAEESAKKEKFIKAEKKAKAEADMADKAGKIQQAADDQALADLKKNLLTQGLDMITNILGKDSKMGKIVALAQAGRNVSEGITKALAQGGIAGIGMGAMVAATGAIQIKKIASSKTLGGGVGSSLGGSGDVSSMMPPVLGTGVFDGSRWSPRGQQLAGDLAGTSIGSDARNNNDSQRSFADSIVQVAVVDINTAQQNRQAKVTEAQLG